MIPDHQIHSHRQSVCYCLANDGYNLLYNVNKSTEVSSALVILHTLSHEALSYVTCAIHLGLNISWLNDNISTCTITYIGLQCSCNISPLSNLHMRY